MIPEETIIEPVSLSLAPYTGTWTKAEAAHLLRRTLFGPTFPQIQQAITDGMVATVDNLLQLPTTSAPLTFHPDEAIAAFGTTWINSPYPSSNAGPSNNARKISLAARTMERINTVNFSIQEKMCLFWANHFGVNFDSESRALYQLHELYRANGLGNFKQLVKDVTINPAMLDFLNGNSNNQYSPNENYSRELLELFTVGKGPQVGPGDYSTYTETDIFEGAKVLTGWTNWEMYSDVNPTAISTFMPGLHDTSTKTLSSYFGNASIPDAGANEYSNYIDIIFQQPNMAKFICRKLYRWFVNYDLTPTVESTVISDMATTLESNNWSILAVMDELLKSEHFYDVAIRGAIIKNPVEFIFSFMKASMSEPTYDLATNYELYLNAYWSCENLGMGIFSPPSVGGWTAYYQVPSFSKLWANSFYIKRRFEYSAWLTLYGGYNVGGNQWNVKALNLLDSLSNPGNAVAVIDDLETLFSPKPLSAATKIGLKAILTNGLPDFEWTVQYTDYINNPGNTTFSDPVRQRVEFVLVRFTQLPQFHII